MVVIITLAYRPTGGGGGGERVDGGGGRWNGGIQFSAVGMQVGPNCKFRKIDNPATSKRIQLI